MLHGYGDRSRLRGEDSIALLKLQWHSAHYKAVELAASIESGSSFNKMAAGLSRVEDDHVISALRPEFAGSRVPGARTKLPICESFSFSPGLSAVVRELSLLKITPLAHLVEDAGAQENAHMAGK